MIIIKTKQNYTFSLRHMKFFFGSDVYSDNGQAQSTGPAGIPQAVAWPGASEVSSCGVTSCF